jgi:methionyl-tRNA formyltransferase
MKIVFTGSGEFGIECLNAIKASGHDLALVVTQPSSPAGRGKVPKPTPVAQWAKENDIRLLEADDINAPDVIEKITSQAFDVLVVIACRHKIGCRLVGAPTKIAINVHASLLPKYRGAAPINWAIVNGEKETGISIITLAQTMDAGDILARAKLQIKPQETAGELHDRLAKLSAPLLIETLNKIDTGTVSYIKQDDTGVCSAPKLKKSDGFLDFSESAEVIARKIRGFWPWPGASADYISRRNNKAVRVTIAQAQAVNINQVQSEQPGIVDQDLNVACGIGSLQIDKIKPAGSALMDFTDFVNGRRTEPGDFFQKIES